MLDHFYSKNYIIEMLSPSMYSPPWSLHRSMRIFHCWKQSCRSSDSLSWASSLLPSLHLWTRTWFLLTKTWTLEIKKSHMGLGQVSTVDVPTRWSCVSSSWQTGRYVLARCLGEEPTFPHFRSPHPFTKVCQNLLVVDLVNGLTFRHPIHVNNPSDTPHPHTHTKSLF